VWAEPTVFDVDRSGSATRSVRAGTLLRGSAAGLRLFGRVAGAEPLGWARLPDGVCVTAGGPTGREEHGALGARRGSGGRRPARRLRFPEQGGPRRGARAVGENGQAPLVKRGGRPPCVCQSGRMFSACGPFWPCVTSNSTFWPSASSR
jgi:hypothetical protein